MERLVSILLALLLLATGAAYAMHTSSDAAEEEPDAPDADAGHDAHAHEQASSSREARLARAEQGKIPELADLASLERFGTLAFRPDSEWTPAAGVDSGTGTAEDPFVIDGVFADVLYVGDTAVDFEVRNSYIRTLVLDWHGDNGLVHHNQIGSMRTNRNVERTGGPSAAVIVHNVIGEVEELRHFDGVVAHNVIGKEGLQNLLDNGVVFNIAGFNGAEIGHNLVYGGLDVKVHGHHHDDGSGHGSHNHGTADASQAESYAEMHGERHHRLDLHDNVVVDPFGFGLRYNDLNHAGDDRQANSEQEPALEETHRHVTHVLIRDNVVDGAPIRVEVFMSPDDLHGPGQEGDMTIRANRVVNVTRDAIVIGAVRDARLVVEDNRLERPLELLAGDGIRVAHLANSTLVVRGNAMDGFRYGVRAADFDEATRWWVEENRIAGASKEAYWDDSVKNAPEGSAEEEAHEHDHAHDPATVARRDALGIL